MMKRRDWLRWSVQWGSALAIASHGARLLGLKGHGRVGEASADDRPLVPPLRDGKWPVLQGATGADAVQFTILFRKSQQPKVQLASPDGSKFFAPVTQQVESRDHSEWSLLKIKYRGLPQGVEFELQLGEGGIDKRRVRLASATRTRSRIAVMSCIEDTGDLATQEKYWTQFFKQEVDALLLIGDHVYVDQGKSVAGESWSERIWRRYAESRLFHELYFAPNLIPVLATWDDHDYGKNDSDGTAPWKNDALAVFNAFFAQDQDTSIGITRGPGSSSAVDLFGVRWVLTDDRTWRGLSSASGPSHWGDEQEAWIDRMIDEASGTVFLCNGSQFFGGYLPGESYEKSHASSFEAFRSRLRSRRNRVFFMSGDRHFSELMRVSRDDVGYETFEFTTSGFLQISHLTIPWPFFKNPRRLAGTSESYNYALIDVEPVGDRSVRGHLASVSNKGYVIFSREFSV